MKKLFILILAAVLAVLSASCGGDDQEVSQTGGDISQTPSQEASAEASEENESSEEQSGASEELSGRFLYTLCDHSGNPFGKYGSGFEKYKGKTNHEFTDETLLNTKKTFEGFKGEFVYVKSITADEQAVSSYIQDEYSDGTVTLRVNRKNGVITYYKTASLGSGTDIDLEAAKDKSREFMETLYSKETADRFTLATAEFKNGKYTLFYSYCIGDYTTSETVYITMTARGNITLLSAEYVGLFEGYPWLSESLMRKAEDALNGKIEALEISDAEVLPYLVSVLDDGNVYIGKLVSIPSVCDCTFTVFARVEE